MILKNNQWISRKMTEKLFKTVSLKYLQTLTCNTNLPTYRKYNNFIFVCWPVNIGNQILKRKFL